MNTIISPHFSPNIRSLGISLTKALTIGAAVGLLVLIIGGALAERIEQRATGDRLNMGELKYGESPSVFLAARSE